MQAVRKAILSHVHFRSFACLWFLAKDGPSFSGSMRHLCAASLTSSDHMMARVIRMVKKYDRIDADKVTEMADFRKDLCLDSLDRVELVMAIEQEFNIEIPDEKADKLTCCADVVKYIMSETNKSFLKIHDQRWKARDHTQISHGLSALTSLAKNQQDLSLDLGAFLVKDFGFVKGSNEATEAGYSLSLSLNDLLRLVIRATYS